MIAVGDRVPDFELRDTARRPVTRADFEGRIGVLAFYPRAFSGGCTVELQGFQGVAAELADLGARIAGVSTDTWAANASFATLHGFAFPLLSDWPAHSTIAAFGVRAEGGAPGRVLARRVTVVFDRAGTVSAAIDVPRSSSHAPVALEAVRLLTDGRGVTG